MNLDFMENDINEFDSKMENKTISVEDKLVELINFELKHSIKDILIELYQKLTEDPIYRGNSTFENFAVNLSNSEKYQIIQIIEVLSKNNKYFNKIDHSDIIWSDDVNYNEKIKKEILEK